MYITLAILLLAAFFFMNGKVRSDLVALCALILLLIFGILTPQEGLSGFSNSIVIMMIGLFVVSGAIFQTGLAKMIGSRILRWGKGSELKLFVLVMLATAAIGAFVSNTGTVALMLPIIVSMCAGAGMNSSRFLMPLAFASSIGGMFTLIGTPPNLVIDETLRGNGYEGLSFFTFAPVGAICLVVGMAVLIPLSLKYLAKKDGRGESKKKRGKSLQELAAEYKLGSNLYRVKLKAGSKASGKTVVEMNIRRQYRLNVLEIRRRSSNQSRFFNSVSQNLAFGTQLQQDDILYVTGKFENVNCMADDYGLEVLTTHSSEAIKQGRGDSLDFYEIGIAEILLLSTTTFANKTIGEINFRDRYDVNVLGIRRKKEYILHDIPEEKLHPGDVLLVQGTWNHIGHLNDETGEWVVLGQPLEEASRVTLDYKAPVAAVIMVLMIAAMALDFIPIAPVTAVMIAAVLMVATGCIRSMEAAYKTINWESIVLIAAMLPMSLALEKTGTAALISDSLVDSIGRHGPVALLAGIYFTASLMTMFISNTATAVLLAPIALQAATSIEASPYPFLFAVAVGASMCFASPFSTPPNALVMPVGQYTFVDYIKVGLPLQIIMGVVMVFVLPLIFPL